MAASSALINGSNCCRTANPRSATGSANTSIAKTPRSNRQLRVRTTAVAPPRRIVITNLYPPSCALVQVVTSNAGHPRPRRCRTSGDPFDRPVDRSTALEEGKSHALHAHIRPLAVGGETARRPGGRVGPARGGLGRYCGARAGDRLSDQCSRLPDVGVSVQLPVRKPAGGRWYRRLPDVRR